MRHKAVIGLGYGDEGKGSTVSYLCSQAETPPLAVVRFNGGAQAAHNVVLDDGTHHTFSQFGSGTLQGVPTILSRFMLLNPVFLFNEAQALLDKTGADPYLNLMVSENALVTTYLHVAMNQHKETQRGNSRHGSVGLGIGETVLYSMTNPDSALRVKDLADWDIASEKLDAIALYYESEGLPLIPEEQRRGQEDMLGYTAELMNIVSDDQISEFIRSGNMVFEGAQGVLLDQKYGFHPYTTWSDVTRNNVDTLLQEADAGEAYVYGTIRTYHTRHGAGPMPSELDSTITLRKSFSEPHNHASKFQGDWRIGLLDLPLLNYALKVCEVDALAVSHLDYPTRKVVDSYPATIPVPRDRPEQIELTETVIQQEGKGRTVEVGDSDELISLLSNRTGKRVEIRSYGNTDADRVTVDQSNDNPVV